MDWRMDNLTQILLTASVTLIGGCLLYFMTHVVSDLLIKPYLEYRKILAEISYTLVFYSNLLTNKRRSDNSDKFDEATTTVRGLAAKLRASCAALPAYRMLRIMRCVQSRQELHEAAGLLIRISNADGVNDSTMIYQDICEIGHILGIDVGRNPSKSFKRRT
jgi:hypothetical protein